MAHLLPTAMEEAAHWFVLLASGEATQQDRERWQAWRTADPAHQAAWQRATDVTARLAGIPSDQAQASLAALARPAQGRTIGRRNALFKVLGVFAMGAAGWQGWRHSDSSADALTAVGEQRELTLADGSLMMLDTNTAVDTQFSSEIRLIRLRRGRVVITTAPEEPHRPFVVATAEGRVRALGTRFVVEQQSSVTRVAVLQARVAVQALQATGAAPILEEGEVARFDRHGLVEQLRTTPAEAAWTRGLLVADDMDLGSVVGELARYTMEPMACDPAVATLRISGTFPLRETNRALAALAGTLPIRVERRVAGGGKTRVVIARK